MNKIFFIFSLSLLLFSCKKPNISASNPATAQEFSDFAIDEVDFDYLTSKAKVHFKDEQNDLKANANIRMKKDSIIWISVNAAAGFEAMRILITTDSIYILDKLKNSYTVHDYSSLSQNLNINLSFRITQAMILGNLMLPRDNGDKISKPDSIYYLLNQSDSKINLGTYVAIENRKIERVEVTEPNESNQLIIKYSNFAPLGAFLFPLQNNITLSYKDENSNSYQTTIEVEHAKTECPDKELNFPFNVPNKFLRK